MLALALLLAAAPISQMSEQQLDRAIAETHLVPAIGERVERLSALFLGVAYGDLPLGEGSGIEPQPRWRTDLVDCQTFVETVLAMANAKSLARARKILDDIRYAGDPPEVSFATRNHFTEAQWLPSNAEKGYLREETREVDPRAPATTLTLRRGQWDKLPALKRLATAKVPEGDFRIHYLTLDEAKRHAKSIEPGSVLLVVRQHDPDRVVRVSHMGFVVRKNGRLYVRHASSGDEHRVIDMELRRFLDKQREYKKWPVQGVALAMPLDAQLRVSRITAAR
ncbi:MAG TPA: N-acetylmuramoyl-L-alanine amidase-like domain-containing protein [Myxococcales bacterium]|nr:N-acetylmuramoyl-L-alanine amidase-like domain-containing protein [Myxococcales bacterium]